MSSLDHHVRQLADEGLQISLWPSERGFQANVKERAGKGWIVVSGEDPVAALTEALRQRAGGVAIREVVPPEDAEPPAQIDIEEAIAAADSECRYCANTGHFYSEPDLGPCGCPAGASLKPVLAADDFDGMLG